MSGEYPPFWAQTKSECLKYFRFTTILRFEQVYAETEQMRIAMEHVESLHSMQPNELGETLDMISYRRLILDDEQRFSRLKI